MYSDLHKMKSGSGWLVTHDWVTPYGVIKAGFWSDGVSVPWIFRWFIHVNGVLLESAILHDYLYFYGIGSKLLADRAFYESSKYFKVNRFKAVIAYYGVKLFGKGNYK